MISNKIDLITSMIINLKITMTNYLKKSIIIFLYQVLKVDQLDKNDIKKFLGEIVHTWEQIINKNRKLLQTTINIDNMEYNIKNNNLVRELKLIYRKIVIDLYFI